MTHRDIFNAGQLLREDQDVAECRLEYRHPKITSIVLNGFIT